MKNRIIKLVKPLSTKRLIQNIANFINLYKENYQYLLIQIKLEIDKDNVQILCNNTNINLFDKNDLRYVRKTMLDNFNLISKNKKILKANRIIIEYIIINETKYNEINNKLS